MLLLVHLLPNAKTDQLVGWEGSTLKIKIAAPPIDGRANEALLRFLGKKLEIAPSLIEIVSGQTSKHKRLHIPLSPEDVRLLLDLESQAG